MRRFLIISSILLTMACSNNILLSEQFNVLNCSDNNEKFDSKLIDSLQLSESRNILFFLDASCSVCFAEFAKFLEKNEDYKYDSLVVVASETYDFKTTQYLLDKGNIPLPKKTRIIFDPKNKIFSIMLNSYGNQNLFLIENKKILAKVNTQYLKFDKQYGFIIEQNQLKK